jgi:hypothetical protein
MSKLRRVVTTGTAGATLLLAGIATAAEPDRDPHEVAWWVAVVRRLTMNPAARTLSLVLVAGCAATVIGGASAESVGGMRSL